MSLRAASMFALLLCLSTLPSMGCSGQPGQEPLQASAAGTSGSTDDETAVDEETAEGVVKAFALEALSIGRGVPAEAKETMRRATALVERDREAGVAVRIESIRLGPEGGRRLCVEYEDPAAADEAFRQIEKMADGVELVNLVVEPCSTSSITPGEGVQAEEEE